MSESWWPAEVLGGRPDGSSAGRALTSRRAKSMCTAHLGLTENNERFSSVWMENG